MCSRQTLPDSGQAHPLPHGINLRSRGVNFHCYLYPKLPVQAFASENQNGSRLPGQLGNLGAATVGIKLQALQFCICLTQYHCASVRFSIFTNRSQNRCTPFMVTVMHSAIKLYPCAFANFNFSEVQWM